MNHIGVRLTREEIYLTLFMQGPSMMVLIC